MRKSGQAQFFEPSDWAHAQLIATAMHRAVSSRDGLTAAMLAALDSASAKLLVTEGDRRRFRVELVREKGDEDEAASVTALDEYQRRFAR